ncbi:hypothetical protein F441_09021, partial [Phytophthora nicotianae CJ01A1]
VCSLCEQRNPGDTQRSRRAYNLRPYPANIISPGVFLSSCQACTVLGKSDRATPPGLTRRQEKMAYMQTNVTKMLLDGWVDCSALASGNARSPTMLSWMTSRETGNPLWYRVASTFTNQCARREALGS